VFSKLTLFPSSGTSVAISLLFLVHWLELMSVRECLCHAVKTYGDIQTKLQVGLLLTLVIRRRVAVSFRLPLLWPPIV
jgi:hypothetical protein